MRFVLQPWQLLLSIVVGWINNEQKKINEYQRTVIQVLLEKMGKNRILLNDDRRRRLAVKAKILGRKVLAQVGALFTPDTILRWHRELVAQKWDHSVKGRKVGRPPTPSEIVELILQFAKENPSWGYDRIADALANIGHEVSDQTVGNVLKDHGIEPFCCHRKVQTATLSIANHVRHILQPTPKLLKCFRKLPIFTFCAWVCRL
jgi:putative transposase